MLKLLIILLFSDDFGYIRSFIPATGHPAILSSIFNATMAFSFISDSLWY